MIYLYLFLLLPCTVQWYSHCSQVYHFPIERLSQTKSTKNHVSNQPNGKWKLLSPRGCFHEPWGKVFLLVYYSSKQQASSCLHWQLCHPSRTQTCYISILNALDNIRDSVFIKKNRIKWFVFKLTSKNQLYFVLWGFFFIQWKASVNGDGWKMLGFLFMLIWVYKTFPSKLLPR